MSERNRRSGRNQSTTEKRTMADVSHTHPTTRETFGAVFQRGPAMADGGAKDRTGRRGETMRDVDHTPRHGEDVSEVWARGGNERQTVRDARRSEGEPVDE
ncbi:hypothetical protein [Haloprofundus sp. MHR1]|uniref:hypothetical protein n=1 Tax=Haloprofundus sp. MHR1 TaxID=2572921 RepID=UPI0010BEB25B|nr:hypothetical protein [Haloprofundus sp. MHR1]QCJ48245.1 hypothetical protein FCF25_14425 [Haloprofundus sp. MHR1]